MKRLKLNRWLISAIALGMFVLVFQPEEIQDPVRVATQVHDTDYFMDKVVIHQFDTAGRRINTLAADRMEHSLKQDTSILETPLITFARSHSGEWQLSSNEGTLLNNSTIIKLDKDVKIEEYAKNKQVQTKITTNQMSINLDTNIASTDQAVLIESPYYQTQSTGLEIEFDQEIIYLKSDVTTKIYQ
jgi:LPS export ABC transporter protein LptC